MQIKGITDIWKAVEKNEKHRIVFDSHGNETVVDPKMHFQKNHNDKINRAGNPYDNRMSIEMNIQKRETIIRLIAEPDLPDNIRIRMTELNTMQNSYE
ncbi:TPA: hypothetical protein R4D26_000935 [Salmonella enterica subsp. enterica serovar Stanley]|nr:hypothetical protein [Salmonella enterica subsp. enterica serovar Stanley]